ncbi:hypothetical protein HMPREF1986_01914 [Oribacterium sp. oral taxon 078 str. F0263]|nr:hypothetical protein HMPREF1986_01914 [Oribacterium sp. oral taxon 078 str. F0263]
MGDCVSAMFGKGFMQELLELLKDGHSRTTVMLASELHTTPEDISRKLEYMEHMGIIRRVSLTFACGGCTGCTEGAKGGESACGGCIPGESMLNMGEMWEINLPEGRDGS